MQLQLEAAGNRVAALRKAKEEVEQAKRELESQVESLEATAASNQGEVRSKRSGCRCCAPSVCATRLPAHRHAPLRYQIERLKASLAQATQRAAKLDAKLQSERERVSQLTQDKASAGSDVKRLTRELDEARTKVAGLGSELQERGTASDELASALQAQRQKSRALDDEVCDAARRGATSTCALLTYCEWHRLLLGRVACFTARDCACATGGRPR